jgi:UDP-N-acetylmuramoyl-tripeptide--D-alanyl-D-alanine ligase
MIVLGLIVALGFAGWRIWRRLRYFLHIFQLEGYKLNEFAAWKRGPGKRLRFRTSHAVGFAVIALAIAASTLTTSTAVAGLVLVAYGAAFASSRAYREGRVKKPLAYTARLKRQLATSAVLSAIPVLAALAYFLANPWTTALPALLLALYLVDLLVPFTVSLAGRLMRPVEASVQEGFKRQARRHLASRPDLTVVAVTGSYGKTSVKFALAEMLSQRFNVLATPSSYNTPMGVCLVVNNRLRTEHQVLVLEMGMRYRGDIRELCELAPPDIAIVTSVGMAHLETMGSIDRIAEEKSDIIRHMKRDGITVLNVDDDRVAAMADLAPGAVWTVSVEGRPADIKAFDISYDRHGSRFTVEDDTGARANFQTPLLGSHNVLNVLLGVAVGRAMGLRLRQLAHGSTRLKPVAHRLELKREGAVTVIDDAFNSNPVGARNAVEVLGGFQGGSRIVVTPGMVELGDRQFDENRIFGTHIARHADFAILVGPKQTAPIHAGLIEAGFAEDRIIVVNSLFEARDYIRAHFGEGDVVLYENDLPDQYNEPVAA